MNAQRLSADLQLACTLILLATAVFVFSCRLTTFESVTPPNGNSVVGRLLGSSCAAIGNRFYAEADRYFHSGVGHVRDVVMRKDWFFRIDTLLRPSVHTHLAGRKVADILPWMKLATRMNPANSETYLVTAFWLGQMREYDAAHRVLAEARHNIPLSHEIALEEGRIFLHEGNDDAAYRCFLACIALAEKKEPEDDDARRNVRAALLYKASIDKRRDDISALRTGASSSGNAESRTGTPSATCGRLNPHPGGGFTNE